MPWTRRYVQRAAGVDLLCAITAVSAALTVRFGSQTTLPYAVLAVVFPVLWVTATSLSGAYDSRFFGTGSEEFRKVLNAGVSLTAGLAILSYVLNSELSRIFLMIAVPGVTALNLAGRFLLRKWLHSARDTGRFMLGVMAVGHESGVADLITELSRDRYHGMRVTAVCLADPAGRSEVAGVPVVGGLDDVASAVRWCAADTVAVTACPEIDAAKLRGLAWELEKTGTGLCVAPSLLDVAGPRTTVRPTAGLTLLHVDHPRLPGARQAVKTLFDRVVAGLALVLLSPLFLAVAVAIRLHDHGPALFIQTRVGKDGHTFRLLKFRTMVIDAEQRLAQLRASNDHDGVLFKMRHDPRITPIGARLRKWSVDELPQLVNVLL
ncbi:MAG: sugar transferase, partial [Nocardiopsaceae bacterium]|nr:sugar transferase [Nocardiopsaceae bacterium]